MCNINKSNIEYNLRPLVVSIVVLSTILGSQVCSRDVIICEVKDRNVLMVFIVLYFRCDKLNRKSGNTHGRLKRYTAISTNLKKEIIFKLSFVRDIF